MATKKAVVKKSAVKKAVGKVSPEEFCAAWKKASEKGQTIEDLAKTLGMKKEAVNARKNDYVVKLELKFPKLARVNNGPRLDKKSLQSILNGHPL